MTKVDTIAVLGAGTMGRGIAHVAALGGYRTHLFDTQPLALERALTSILENLDKGVQRGKVEADAADAARGLLDTHSELSDAVGNADLVIEAVPESMDLKKSVLAAVVAHAPTHALLASNTSGLSISEMAAATDRPERFAGMHFFNPVHIMRLVELVIGEQTSQETLDAMAEVSRAHGQGSGPGEGISRIRHLPHQRPHRQ